MIKVISRYFDNPPLPLRQEAERPRIIIFRKYLAIIFGIYACALVLELIFDFQNYNWFHFTAILLTTLLFSVVVSQYNTPISSYSLFYFNTYCQSITVSSQSKRFSCMGFLVRYQPFVCGCAYQSEGNTFLDNHIHCITFP